ncbi:hypothetical protein BO86DRAFT_189956 [Aspergillus japonicus CBS 114.51]|uniref:Zn(2)-C6 fungal-type domain-containing protein n=1 Tax=Aspergillus japonicus CBS 114.51 TaxID=1448312 RepID=A0A8T8XAX8_ASPJA|nr:hypothetical protein BO86DRAFT_189956 [Aspergillus japonicus CBS 114.51]RAH85377.1 hypothetical protein BO86DRAFT_189956 [Aspergillus japonicus CBS 114.51]
MNAGYKVVSLAFGEKAGRTRVSRACDRCHRQKIKCDAAQPRCNWCTHQDVPCLYDRQRKRRRNYMQPRENARSSQDGLHINASDHGVVGDSTLPPSKLRNHTAEHLSGHIPITKGNASLSSASDTIPAIPCTQGSQHSRQSSPTIDSFSSPPWENIAQYDPGLNHESSSIDRTSLPDYDVIKSLAIDFYSSIYSSIFPIIDPILFQRTLSYAYEIDPRTRGARKSACLCVWAFLAFMSIHQLEAGHRISLTERLRVLHYIETSMHIGQEPDIDLLQTSVIMIVVYLFSGKLRMAVMWSTFASRAVLLLGGHSKTCLERASLFTYSIELGSRKDAHLRNLFWLCYHFDKELCRRTEQPPFLSEHNCDLSLPRGYKDYVQFTMEADIYSRPLFPGDLRLTEIRSQAYAALYSRRALEKSDGEILQAIRTLDGRLEEWRMAVAPDHRPKLFFSAARSIGRDGADMRAVMLRLEFYHCLAYVHLASTRCKSWSHRHKGELEGVSTSLKISVSACRSSLQFLLAVKSALKPKVFWLVVFYPIIAMQTILWNVQENASTQTATDDVTLISEVAQFMHGLATQAALQNEGLGSEDRVCTFIADLERAARQSVLKSAPATISRQGADVAV